ncbi:MAG: SpoIIE family protein phosphatase [Sphaerochaetaceae bacterium]|nr:SpoIIE family protein phosphatase [Sphaerochaetaceae bacterium]
MNIATIKLILTTMMPVAVSAIFSLLNKTKSFSALSYKLRQTIIGVVFGGLAIMGTEWGIPMNGAIINCRDASVLSAGLFFGPWAGILAGLIGGIERWIASLWGVGYFLRVACSLATIIAGFFGAIIRVYLFENKRPSWLVSGLVGVVMEFIHLTLAFVTNMDEIERAMDLITTATTPMVFANGISVMAGAILVSIIDENSYSVFTPRKNRRISDIIQSHLVICMLSAFTITTVFMLRAQKSLADSQTYNFLSQTISDVEKEVNNVRDYLLITAAQLIKEDVSAGIPLSDIAEKHEVEEINIIDGNGIITESTYDGYLGYNMFTGRQSSEFMFTMKKEPYYVQKYGAISVDSNVMRKYVGIAYDTGCIQVGYGTEEHQREFNKVILLLLEHRRVGETGGVIVFDSDGRLVSSSVKMPPEILFDKVDDEEEMKVYTCDYGTGEMYYMFTTQENYIIVSVYPKKEALKMRNIGVNVYIYLQVLVYGALFLLVYILLKIVVVSKIRVINGKLAEITDGKLDTQVKVMTNEEFAALSNDINATVEKLKGYIAEASARIDAELGFAKAIQFSVLPREFPNNENYEIFASMDTAKEVGGDFYDFYRIENRLYFLMADVSGKGIPAALFMMRGKTELKGLSESGLEVQDVFTAGNDNLCEGNDAEMFITAWQGVLDLDTGNVCFANAGHEKPLIRRKSGRFEFAEQKCGFVLAGMPGIKYKKQEFHLEPGDEIFLYTDGIPEATNANGEFYGEERLLKAVNSHPFVFMRDLCEYVTRDIDKFVGDAAQFDDITMLALRYNGPSASIG